MPQCAAFTLQGLQCRRQAAVGSTCCAQHIGLTAAENERRRLIVPQRLQEEENWRAAVHQAAQLRRFPHIRQAQEARARAAGVIQEAEAVIADANRRIGRIGPVPIHQDAQNVHRREVNQGQKPILDALARRHMTIPCLIETLDRYSEMPEFKVKLTLGQRICNLFRVDRGWWTRVPLVLDHAFFRCIGDIRAGNRYAVETQWADGSKGTIALADLLVLAIDRITTAPAEHRVALNRRFLEELKDGERYCLVGRFARVLNAFAGFEEVVLGIKPVDPRSLNERLGDAFAALGRSEQTVAEKQAAGERLLTENGVLEPAARAVWLTAL